MNALPIPLLDRELLGRHWHCYIGSSGFGTFMRASRLNLLRRADYHKALGISVRANEDVFRKTCVSQKLHEALAVAMAAPEMARKNWWTVDDWWPFAGAIPWDDMPWRLRLCPACARSCYHSLLFQMPGVTRCPWHGIELIEECPRCGRQLLTGIQHDLPVGKCPCGHDFVDYVDSVEGDKATLEAKSSVIEGYRIWAAASRRVNYLIRPEQWDPFAWRALHQLAVQPPAALLPSQHVPFRSYDPHVFLENVRIERTMGHPRPPLGPTSGLQSGKPSVVSLPITWFAPLHRVGEELVRMLPADASERLKTDRQLRNALENLPVYTGAHNVFLHTECLHRSVCRVLARLASTISVPSKEQLYADALVLHVKGHDLGPELVQRMIYRLLLRGYADGARVALGHHALELYDHSRTRPATRYPWTVLCLPPGRVPSGRIAWARQSGTD